MLTLDSTWLGQIGYGMTSNTKNQTANLAERQFVRLQHIRWTRSIQITSAGRSNARTDIWCLLFGI